jgi:hypothetical protein
MKHNELLILTKFIEEQLTNDNTFYDKYKLKLTEDFDVLSMERMAVFQLFGHISDDVVNSKLEPIDSKIQLIQLTLTVLEDLFNNH